jgi:hypothetical protein
VKKLLDGILVNLRSEFDVASVKDGSNLQHLSNYIRDPQLVLNSIKSET